MNLKTISSICMCVFILHADPVFSQSNPEVLTNETITLLTRKGLGSSIIINKIKTSKTNFDVSTDALIQLKSDGIPDDVVATMIEYQKSKEVVVLDMNDPLVRHESGIWYFNANEEQKLTHIDPTVASGSSSGGFGTALAQAYSYGLANNSRVTKVSGSNARKQINNTHPVFYFYFSKTTNDANSVNWWFAQASSPNEFCLVKMKSNKQAREFVIGKNNAWGATTGIEEKCKVAFDYQEVSDGIFKVVIRGELAKGEYCFMFTGATPSIHSNDRVFDFGIF